MAKTPERARHWTLTVFGTETEQDNWLHTIQTQINNEQHQFSKLLIGGWELSQDNTRHCHVLVQFKNTRKYYQVKALLQLTNIKTWITPRLQTQTLHEIEQHHVKQRTKIGDRILYQYPPNHVTPEHHLLFEQGITETMLPTMDTTEDDTDTPVNKKRKLDGHEILAYAEAGNLKKIKEHNPGFYIANHAKLKALNNKQKKVNDTTELDHYWIHGPTGTGKTLSVNVLFPDAFERDPDSHYYDGYTDQKQIILTDLDNRALRTLGVNKLKTMCDPNGFNMEIKYGGGHLVKAQIIVTSNFTIEECFKFKGKNANYNQDWYSDIDLLAVQRRFKELHINNWLFQNNIRLKSIDDRNEIKRLQREENVNYELKDLFEEHQLDRIYKPSESHTQMEALSTQLDKTNQTLVNEGYINHNPFPRMLFDYCESSEDTQIWRSSANNMTLKIVRVPDTNVDGSDAIEFEMHPRTPDISDTETEDLEYEQIPATHPDYILPPLPMVKRAVPLLG